MEKEIICFIYNFTDKGKRTQVTDTFKNGCCYWFAFILSERFKEFDAKIVYSIEENHFGCEIGNRVYDISGDITENFNWIVWDEMQDENHKRYIIRDCIRFEPIPDGF